MITAIALDKEPQALEVLERFCKATGFIALLKCFTSPDEAAKHLAQWPVDLLFLDMSHPSLLTVELKANIGPDMLVIFTTASPVVPIDAFELNAIDCLRKSFSYQRFFHATEKAKLYHLYFHDRKSLENQTTISVRVDYASIKIALSDILFIETLGDYLKIHLQRQEPIMSRISLKAFMAKLPANEFVRVHRSYVAPLAKIKMVKKGKIILEGVALPIGKSFKQRFLERFENYGRQGRQP